MKHLKPTYLLLFLFAFFTQISTSQVKTIEIKEAGFGEKDEENHPGASILIRNNQSQVHIYHDGIDMFCDKAVFYGKEDFIEAYGNVIMKQGDTINLTAKYAEYSGKTKLAFASGDVLLTEPSSTLTTDTLYLNREAQQAYYKSGGRVVRDSSGVITSTVGRFYMKEKKYRFLNTVKLVNPEYTLTTNQLDFYTETGHAYMYGPSYIIGETSKIYSERGFYNTNNDTGYFEKNAKIDYDNREVKGDSLYFDRSLNFASATNNITITDTLNKSIIKGHYAEVYRAKDSVFITKRALGITIQENDSIYIHADTLMVTGKADKRITRAFKNAKIYKSDLSGKADSLHVNHQTGLTELININNGKIDAFTKTKKPVLWHLKNQMSGDTIHIISNPKTEKVDSLKVFKNAFMISKDSIAINGYNQISGQRLIGLFNDKNEIYRIDVLKNAESIYYARNDNNELIGIERSKSANISIFFENQDVDELRKLQQIDGTLFKEEDINAKERILKGFNWREDERPKSVEDLFVDDLPLNLPIIKGLEEAVPEEEFFNKNLINRMIDADKTAKDKQLTKEDQLPKSSRNLPKKFISKDKKGKRQLETKSILELEKAEAPKN